MLINDIIQTSQTIEGLKTISEQCSDFINNSDGKPLLKNLPATYENFHKVKVRKRKQRKEDSEEFAKLFNEAFEQEMENLRERSVFANGERTFTESEEPDQNVFFIFPIDGYEFMYSKEVENSSTNYKSAFDAILEKLGADKGKEVIAELLKFNYTSDQISEGIQSGSEIIIYNIPYFYAIRKNAEVDYQELITKIKEM